MTLSLAAMRRLAVLAVPVAITACTPGHHAAGPPAASPPAAVISATPAPGSTGSHRPAQAGLDGCFSASRGTITTVRDAAGGRLKLGIVGSGPRVVVMSNESDGYLCSWLPLSARLAASGYRVVLWDYDRRVPAATELMGLVKHLRSAGARRIVLMGASEGAKASLVAAARIGPRVRGVVSLSAESVLTPGIVVIHYVRRLRCPLLFVTAARDPYGSAQAARRFLSAAPSTSKRLVTVPGDDHGTDLLAGHSAATTVPAIVAFLHRVLG